MRKYRYHLYILLALNVLFTGCSTIYNPATNKNETYIINEKTEIVIGNNVAQRILNKNKIVKDTEILAFIDKIGNKIAGSSDRKNIQFSFYVLDDKEINAFALPGGHVFINKGLITKATENEIAFVIGHEIGHICARHSLKKMQTSLGLNFLLSIAFQDPQHQALRRAVNDVYTIVALGYSRSDELLADSLGIKYMKKAGYNVYGAVKLLEILKRESNRGNIPVFLSSHPTPETRIKNAKEKISSIK